jgi:hypothetical protein
MTITRRHFVAGALGAAATATALPFGRARAQAAEELKLATSCRRRTSSTPT